MDILRTVAIQPCYDLPPAVRGGLSESDASTISHKRTMPCLIGTLTNLCKCSSFTLGSTSTRLTRSVCNVVQQMPGTAGRCFP